jgi:hypothetical protein
MLWTCSLAFLVIAQQFMFQGSAVMASILAGAITGVFETLLMYPIENLKTQQQLFIAAAASSAAPAPLKQVVTIVDGDGVDDMETGPPPRNPYKFRNTPASSTECLQTPTRAYKFREMPKIPRNAENSAKCRKFREMPKIPRNAENSAKCRKFREMPKIPRNSINFRKFHKMLKVPTFPGEFYRVSGRTHLCHCFLTYSSSYRPKCRRQHHRPAAARRRRRRRRR